MNGWSCGECEWLCSFFSGRMDPPLWILGGGFKYFLCSPRIPGEMIQFDEHIFSKGLKPPTKTY